MIRQNTITLLVAFAGTFSLLTYSHSFGQTIRSSDVEQNANEIQEIVVTANRREERIQDVAMAVTAIGGAELTQAQTLDLQDLASKVPGLNLQEGGFVGNGVGNRIILRGLNTGNSGATVASVVDNVPFSLSGSLSEGANFATDLDTYDLDHIEVLRGPQGSLYGATAEGGLIKYVTKAPNLTTLEGGVEGGGWDLDHGGVGGSGKLYVNVPLIENQLALRASGYYEHHPGWIDDRLAGKTRANAFDRYGGRAALLWQANDDLSIRANALVQQQRSENLNLIEVNGNFNPSNPFGLVNGYNDDSYLLQPNAVSSEIFSLNIDYNLHWGLLQSITSGGSLHQTFGVDDSIYVALNNAIGLFGRPDTTLTEYGVYGMTKYSQEFRLSSSPGTELFGHALEWQSGLFFTHEAAHGLNHYVTRDFPSGDAVVTGISPTTPEVYYTNLPSFYQELAGYADGTYHFNQTFDLEVGGRVFHNQQHSEQSLGGALFGPPYTTVTDLGEVASQQTAGTYSTAARVHFTKDQMAYARIASGYRPGGPESIIPGGPAGLPTQYGSDSTVNYEVGFKGSALDRKLSIDVDVFYIDWSKVQVTAVIVTGSGATESGSPETENVGKATSKGVEWTLNWTPLDGLQLMATGAYTDAKLGANAPGINAFSGDQLPYVSKVMANFGAQYDWHFANDRKAFIAGGWSYVGSRFNDFSLNAPDSHLRIPSYNTYDAQAGFQVRKYSIELYAKNLSDARGITNYGAGTTVLGTFNIPGSAIFIRPRTLGLRVSADF